MTFGKRDTLSGRIDLPRDVEAPFQRNDELKTELVRPHVAASQTAETKTEWSTVSQSPLGDASRQRNSGAASHRPALMLRSAEFRKGREEGWRQLDDMVTKVEKSGIGILSAKEAQILPLLYRSALSSLSVARAIALDRNLLRYLENLALRSYLVVYGPRTGVIENLSEFLVRGFPKAVRSIRWHLLIVLLALVVGTAAGTLLVLFDEAYFSVLIPGDLAGDRGPSSTAEQLLKGEIFAPWPGFVESFIAFANYLFSHNTMVGILCFALGLAAGVPTIILIAYQGLVIGAMIALHVNRGLTVDFIGWLSIHGVTEILAILLCGAAGLVVAEKILFPGSMGRLESLSKRGREAATIAAGAAMLFFIAGILEGGFRQLIANTPGRFAVAAITGLLWFAYFMSDIRKPSHGS